MTRLTTATRPRFADWRPVPTSPAHRLACALAVLLIAPLLLVLQPEEATAASSLPSCPSVKKRVGGSMSSGIDATNRRATWNLRRAVWKDNAPNRIEYPIRSDAWTRGCLIGGRVHGNVPRRWTRDQWYDGEDGGRRMGGEVFRQNLTNTADNFLLIRGAYASDFEDAFDPNAARWDSTTYLDHVRAKYIRDDCIENEDVPHNMVITDSLFDGCFTGIAQRPGSDGAVQNGQGPHSFTMRNSLMYIKPQPLGPNYCDASDVPRGRCAATDQANRWLGAHGIWKWSPQAAHKVTIRNTVFRLDMASYSSCSPQVWPRGTYKNVILVWAGKGRYRTAGGCTNVLPPGVTLTTDLAVWRRAKRAWLNN